MKKMLKPRDLLLLGLTNALDLFEEIKDPLHLISKSYENMYGWIPDKYKKHQCNHLIWRTLKTGDIKKVEKNGKIYLRITSQGSRRTARDFPLLHLQSKRWDGKWRIAMFDVAEVQKEKRDHLREKLKELGFGMLQESVFVTPHDIVKDFFEYAESIGLKDSVDVLEANIFGNSRDLARRIWKLDNLGNGYRDILEEAQKIKSTYLTKSSGRADWLNREVERIRGKYMRLLLCDPFLPSELLPKGYLRTQAGKQIRELFRI